MAPPRRNLASEPVRYVERTIEIGVVLEAAMGANEEGLRATIANSTAAMTPLTGTDFINGHDWDTSPCCLVADHELHRMRGHLTSAAVEPAPFVPLSMHLDIANRNDDLKTSATECKRFVDNPAADLVQPISDFALLLVTDALDDRKQFAFTQALTKPCSAAT